MSGRSAAASTCPATSLASKRVQFLIECPFAGYHIRREEISMDKKQLFVERRSQGDYAVRKPNAERSGAVEPTQKAAIERAKELNPDKSLLVERVRNTNTGGRD